MTTRQLDSILGLRRIKVYMDANGISKKIPHVAKLIASAEQDLNVLNPVAKTYRFLVLQGKDGYSTYLNGVNDISVTDADDGQFTLNIHQGPRTYSYIANLSVSADNADALAFYKTGLKRFRGMVKTTPIQEKSYHHMMTIKIVDAVPRQMENHA